MNLDYTFDNYRFNIRVSAIIYNKDKTKILIFNMEGNDYYMLPGGRIEMFEDSLSAIKREIKEETNFDLNYNLIQIQENFVTKGNQKIMQYCFCYEAIFNGNIVEKFKCLDNDSQTFYWINLSDIDNYNIVPKSTYNIINKSDILFHIIEKSTI